MGLKIKSVIDSSLKKVLHPELYKIEIMPTHLILHLAGRQNVRDHRGKLLRDVGGCGVKK